MNERTSFITRVVRVITNGFTHVVEGIAPMSVDHIVKRFETDLGRLRKVAENRRSHADIHMEAANDLIETAKKHAVEAERADRIADRMAAFVG